MLIPVEFNNRFPIRVVFIASRLNPPWFVGKDVAHAMGFSDTRSAVVSYCTDMTTAKTLVGTKAKSLWGVIDATRMISAADVLRLADKAAYPYFSLWANQLLETLAFRVHKAKQEGAVYPGVPKYYWDVEKLAEYVKRPTPSVTAFLVRHGYMTREDKQWVPTEVGEELCQVAPKGTQTKRGALALRWNPDVLLPRLLFAQRGLRGGRDP